jgi:hypothetical protein
MPAQPPSPLSSTAASSPGRRGDRDFLEAAGESVVVSTRGPGAASGATAMVANPRAVVVAESLHVTRSL